MTARERIQQRRDEAAMIVMELDALLELIDGDEAEADPVPEVASHTAPSVFGKPKTEKPAGGIPAPKTSAAPRIRELLAAEGPLMNAVIAERLGIHKTTVLGAFKAKPEWFQKQPPAHLKCPWELTEAGKAAT